MKKLSLVAALVVAATAVLAASSLGAGATDRGTARPFTFFLTHYTLLGNDPNSPTGVRYQDNGRPSAKAANGSTVVLTGRGGWDPAAGSATGGGTYAVTSAAGAMTAHGTWHPTRFVSFLQLAGWWPKGFKEVGWQGSRGSPSYSGILTLNVQLSGLGTGVLKLYCLMPGTPKPAGHASDGLTLTGPKLHFTKQIQSYEGVMYYG